MLERMKRHLTFIIATVLCVPFCVLVALFLVALALKAVGVATPAFVVIPLLHGFIWFSAWLELLLPVLGLVSISVVASWMQQTKTRLEIVLTGLYSAVLIFHLAYAIWCIATKQVFDL